MLNNAFPLVSIIIPTKGCSDTIERAIFSVLNQDYPNIECINVDYPVEGNLTFKIVQKILKKHKSVNYIKSDVANLAFQRNLGVKHAKGEFVVFLDGDDSLDTGFVSKMYKIYLETQSDIVCCSYKKIINESGKIIKEKTYLKTGVFSSIQILKKMYTKSHTALCLCTCKFAKRNLYIDIPINEDILNEDEATTYKHFLASTRIAILNEQLYNYYCYNRQTLSSSHLTNVERQVDGLFKVYLERYNLFIGTNCKHIIFESYYELLNQSLSYAYLFKVNKNDEQLQKCVLYFKTHFIAKKLILHPIKLSKLLLKLKRVC